MLWGLPRVMGEDKAAGQMEPSVDKMLQLPIEKR